MNELHSIAKWIAEWEVSNGAPVGFVFDSQRVLRPNNSFNRNRGCDCGYFKLIVALRLTRLFGMKQMIVPRIYADFNGLSDNEVSLEFMGSLRDLSRLRLRLSEGMEVIVYDPSDGEEIMEMSGKVAYRFGRWGAALDASSFRRVPNPSKAEPPFEFPCFHCGKDIYGWLCMHTLHDDTRCPECNGLVREAVCKPALTP